MRNTVVDVRHGNAKLLGFVNILLFGFIFRPIWSASSRQGVRSRDVKACLGVDNGLQGRLSGLLVLVLEADVLGRFLYCAGSVNTTHGVRGP